MKLVWHVRAVPSSSEPQIFQPHTATYPTPQLFPFLYCLSLLPSLSRRKFQGKQVFSTRQISELRLHSILQSKFSLFKLQKMRTSPAIRSVALTYLSRGVLFIPKYPFSTNRYLSFSFFLYLCSLCLDSLFSISDVKCLCLENLFFVTVANLVSCVVVVVSNYQGLFHLHFQTRKVE